MSTKAKISLKIPIVVEVDTEWDSRTRQSVIVRAKVAEETILTPRMIYQSMSSGDYATLDRATFMAMDNAFNETAESYSGKPLAEYPEEEIRGVPVAPATWGRVMKKIYGSYLQVPVTLVLESTKPYHSRFLVESVLGRVSTAYFWNVDPADDVLGSIERVAVSMKSPQATKMEDGSLRLRWNR